ncbi:hypothetical protein CK936_23320 [Streptomyces albireticuli]|uniref:Uncharacterized protein n=2 Tax=Streptomyces albireticuli TaxID=1940 RepID=A0A2A2D4Z0_9ACTN|nr:hypothetical protein CK936_23320 [Streptomyces albireticuli]
MDIAQRVTRLTELVNALLAEHEQEVGRPPAGAEEIRAALREVAEIPEYARGLRVSGRRAGYADASASRRRGR